MLIDGHTPEDYAALWGCDPAYDKPPRKPGDGYLFYNYGSTAQVHSAWWLKEFAAAIKRTIAGVQLRPECHEKHDVDDLTALLRHARATKPARGKKIKKG